ncbi:MAG: FMN-binding protein [Oscillospiraceae bacterium]
MKNKEIVKSIVVLVVICLLTSAALAVVNHFTAPVSAANAEARAQQARLDAVPDAADFAPIEAALPDGVVSAYAALDAAGTPTSYLFTVEGKGFGGTIQVLCVIGMDGRIRTCRTMDVSSETTHARPDRKRELHRPVRRAGPSLSGVSAISGATITSTAYRGCVETAFEAFELVKEAQQ